MKYPTLQKVMLTSMALVASLALTAQAGSPTLSSAKEKNGTQSGRLEASASRSTGNTSWHQVLFPASTYMIDDGTAEDAVGLTLGGDIISLNEFDVIPGSETITTISIAWGTPVFPDPSLDGLSYTAILWSDDSGTGNPANGTTVLATAPGVVSAQGTDTFLVSDIPDTVVTTAKFYVGFIITHSGGQFPAAFDETAPTFSNRSYVAGGASGDINNLNNNDLPVAPIESFGLVGNWLVRADSNGNPTPTPTPTPTATPPQGALWYNGDFDGVDGLTNEQDTFATGYSHIYDDFNVPDSAGWDVDSVFSDNLASTTIIGASWEIRQGITSGNGGTLIASGTTMTPVVTATGRSGFGFTEFMVEVTGLSVHLDLGTYHLNVTPIGNLDGNRSFDSTTSGANCIGTPCGDNDNAFLDSTLFGAVFEPVADFGSQFHDFSMGVNGTVSGGGGGEITLTATFRHKHDNRLVALSWTPADGGTMDILRDGVVIRTVEDDGRAQDNLGTGGREVHVYQVCETDTGDCSNELKIKVPGSGQ
ncbi:MAG: hypothetical protein H0W66_01095 [Chthoniobacterales bacterium]|nr:hypothetical protein [Chthoniobacterales bacterium]